MQNPGFTSGTVKDTDFKDIANKYNDMQDNHLNDNQAMKNVRIVVYALMGMAIGLIVIVSVIT